MKLTARDSAESAAINLQRATEFHGKSPVKLLPLLDTQNGETWYLIIIAPCHLANPLFSIP